MLEKDEPFSQIKDQIIKGVCRRCSSRVRERVHEDISQLRPLKCHVKDEKTTDSNTHAGCIKQQTATYLYVRIEIRSLAENNPRLSNAGLLHHEHEVCFCLGAGVHQPQIHVATPAHDLEPHVYAIELKLVTAKQRDE